MSFKVEALLPAEAKQYMLDRDTAAFRSLLSTTLKVGAIQFRGQRVDAATGAAVVELVTRPDLRHIPRAFTSSIRPEQLEFIDEITYAPAALSDPAGPFSLAVRTRSPFLGDRLEAALTLTVEAVAAAAGGGGGPWCRQTLEGAVRVRLPGLGRAVEGVVRRSIAETYRRLPEVVAAWQALREEAARRGELENLLAGRPPLGLDIEWIREALARPPPAPAPSPRRSPSRWLRPGAAPAAAAAAEEEEDDAASLAAATSVFYFDAASVAQLDDGGDGDEDGGEGEEEGRGARGGTPDWEAFNAGYPGWAAVWERAGAAAAVGGSLRVGLAAALRAAGALGRGAAIGAALGLTALSVQVGLVRLPTPPGSPDPSARGGGDGPARRQPSRQQGREPAPVMWPLSALRLGLARREEPAQQPPPDAAAEAAPGGGPAAAPSGRLGAPARGAARRRRRCLCCCASPPAPDDAARAGQL